jgi:hypothetical protein
VVLDRPQIIEAARTYWNGKISEELLARIEFQSGNMFESLPIAVSEKDLYVFFAMFHTLNDEQSNKVLSNLRSAIGSKQSYLLIADSVAEEMQVNPTIAAFDMQMLIGTKGRERTLSEWTALLEGAGFEIVEVITVRTFAKFIVAKLHQPSGYV